MGMEDQWGGFLLEGEYFEDDSSVLATDDDLH